MQSTLARARARRRRRWLRRGRVLLFGALLGLLQILLMIGWGHLQQWPFAWLPFVVLSVFFSLAVPALDGLIAFRQHEDPASGFGPGCLVGGIGFLILVVALPVALTLALVSPPPPCPPGGCVGAGALLGGAIGEAEITFFLLLEGIAGVVGGLLGGWIGGLLGKRLTAAP